jgi:hypothetical protein
LQAHNGHDGHKLSSIRMSRLTLIGVRGIFFLQRGLHDLALRQAPAKKDSEAPCFQVSLFGGHNGQ